MLSPILWQLNNPDRFDMYSVGVLLLQMAMPALRTDSALINFRRKLEACKYNLREWRRQQVCACLLVSVFVMSACRGSGYRSGNHGSHLYKACLAVHTDCMRLTSMLLLPL